MYIGSIILYRYTLKYMICIKSKFLKWGVKVLFYKDKHLCITKTVLIF